MMETPAPGQERGDQCCDESPGEGLVVTPKLLRNVHLKTSSVKVQKHSTLSVTDAMLTAPMSHISSQLQHLRLCRSQNHRII